MTKQSFLLSASRLFQVTNRYQIASVSPRSNVFVRCYSLDRADSDQAEEFIERHLAKAETGKPKETASNILTTRREALSLFRSVLRASRLFVWRTDQGDIWRDVIRDSARKEFEAARYETDPEMVTKLLVAGRHYTEEALSKFMAKRAEIIKSDEDLIRQGKAYSPYASPSAFDPPREPIREPAREPLRHSGHHQPGSPYGPDDTSGNSFARPGEEGHVPPPGGYFNESDPQRKSVNLWGPDGKIVKR
eukprot:CAMPEP_0197844022 /NCGR_PEP_ID=MMETSP1438-20131217/988_1 /TAXON_ID=1461541 /ORGANISM="Pterosperma sp., Strain CCMP1384" /LENGTH=247 /DNA_ID=CAMNT_0043454547 /DNA_START=32 /DNA_END=775 /DNA_ORIENTATION=+